MAHLSAALRQNTIELMGPTDAKRNGPYGQLENAIEITKDCKYCWDRQCRFNLDCLAQIPLATVVEKLQNLI
jgi:heptosyltransferase-1